MYLAVADGFNRWDSSDPERAPPPLPLNPGTPSSPVTRANTSARIEEAAALISAKARENAPSTYTTNVMTNGSPEKSLIKPHHRRMQSVQNGTVRGLSDSLERRSPEKGFRGPKLEFESRSLESRSPERSPTRTGSETPVPSGRATPTHLNKPILGENTPPSATMLALQSMRARAESEAPLSNITNSSTNIGRAPYTFDAISAQILSLTNIATNLQREMAALSRRSKDNATDLISLKEATNARDEDIRMSLKELVMNLDTKLLTGPEPPRATPTPGLYLDNKAHNRTPSRKNFNLPRIPSPNSFSAAIERELTASPSIVSSDGAASIALLEKVLREMGTKDGQEKILHTLENVKSSSTQSRVDPSLMTKLEEVLQFLKDNSPSRALVRSHENFRNSDPSGLIIETGQLARTTKDVNSDKPHENAQATEFVNDEVMKVLKRVKQSVSEGGGLTNEVKALVRELRGEVLGMGREIARKLEQAESSQKADRQDIHGPSREEIAQIVEAGLHELKQHMHELIRENRRQSAASTKSMVDTQEVVSAVRSALAEIPMPRQEPPRDLVAEREEMISAVREAWEDCKPEIALEHFGLERDEILDTLKEGLRSYQPQNSEIREVGASYDEVLEAVQKGLADFKPPAVETEASITREEVFMAVRECLESFEFPIPMPPAPTSKESDLTREDVLDAVKEGLNSQGHITKEIEFNRDDLFDAVKAGLEGAPTPMGGVGEQVLEQMHEFLASMKTEFKQYSAANGKDTEQVLDAMTDGFEELRANIKSYVDRAADVTGKDEIIDTVKEGFRVMQADIEKVSGNRGDSTNTPELLDAMEKEFEHLRETITKSLTRATASSDREEILDAIRDLSEERASTVSSNSEDIARLVKEELEHMRTTLAGTLVRAGSSVDREEIMDAIREGLGPASGVDKDEILEVIREGIETNRSPLVSATSNIDKEEILETIREALEATRTTLVPAVSNVDREEILETIREGLESNRSSTKVDGNESILSNTSELLDAFQEGVDGIRSDMEKIMNRPVDLSASYEILDTLKAGLEGVRADIERLHTAQRDLSDTATAKGREVMIHDENLISTEIEGLKVMITQLRIKVEAMDVAAPVQESLNKDDFAEVQNTLKEVQAAVGQLSDAKINPAGDNVATKEDTDAIETLLRNVKSKLDDFSLPDVDGLAKSSQLDSLEDLLKRTKDIVEEADTHARGEHASKEDFGIVELLLKEVVSGVEELQDKVKILSSDEDRVTKTDIQVVETLCLDTKTQLDAFTSVDFTSLPTQDDFKTIHDTVKTFQERVEAENELTAQAFEARKIEHGGLANKIEDVKGILSEIRGELIEKLDGSEEGIVELSKVLGHHHESMSNYASAESITELGDLIKKEFEKQQEQQIKSNSDNEERGAALFSKHEETQTVLSSELSAKIEDKFNELMTKYDDAQVSNESKLQTLEERDGKHLDALTSTKAVVDDLKLLIDTLGSTTTEACDRMSDDSKTVFNRVAEANSKLDELHRVSTNQHGIMRDEIGKTLATATRLEGSIHESQPAVLSAIKDVMTVVAQHYEHSQAHYQHSQSAAEELRSNINAIPSAIPPLLPALPAPPPPLTREVPIPEKYDDSQVHDKLNVLLNHASGAEEALSKMEDHASSTKASLANMEKLDKIHEQMLATAAEVSSMVSTQTRLMAEHHDSRATEAAEAGVALEKRVAQKEKVEAEIVALNGEKQNLREEVEVLKKEREELAAQSKRLTREVAKLETALCIRQEEMRDMEVRAEKLERRILEGVMDHARSMNLLRPAVSSGSARRDGKVGSRAAERDRAMSLKRVVSGASSTATAKTVGTRDMVNGGSSSTLGSAVGMALKKRTPLGTAATNSTVSSSRSSGGVERRILSTSHVTGNRCPHDQLHAAERALILAPATNTGNNGGGLVTLKRSHSVKSNPSSYYGRKRSWNLNGSALSSVDRDLSADKENEVLTEEEEGSEEGRGEEDKEEEEMSEAGTERRTSFSGTSAMYTVTDTSSMLYGMESTLSRNTSSAGTGGRSVSYASSAAGVIGGKEGSILEENEEEDEVGEEHPEDAASAGDDQAEAPPSTEEEQIMALLGPPTSTTDHQPSPSQSQDHDAADPDTNQLTLQPDFDTPTPSSPHKDNAVVIYGQHSDSGLGTEPPTTADLERLKGFF